jgi:hypothetical protein
MLISGRRKLRSDTEALSQHATDLQTSKILERGNALRRRIVAWAGVQQLYMPVVAGLRLQDEEGGGEVLRPFDVKLYLPSETVGMGSCDPHLQEYEWLLREAQALDALGSLRQHVLCRTHLLHNKNANVRGQQETLRSWTAIQGLDNAIKMDASRYRKARRALEVLALPLGKSSSWEAVYKTLEEGDIRGMSVAENGRTQGTQEVSWIWKVQNWKGTESEELDEGEFCSTPHDH